MKGVKLSVYWPDDWKSVHPTIAEWQEILNGKEFSNEGEGFHYQGGQGCVGQLSDEEIKKEFY